jgi:acetate kinase
MNDPAPRTLLTINTGSSSLKAGVYRAEMPPLAASALEIERIGHDGCRLRLSDETGKTIEEREIAAADHRAALQIALDRLAPGEGEAPWLAIVHRLVHGGPDFTAPVRIDDRVFEELTEVVPLAPNHLPQALNAIEATRLRFPEIPQIACFDTTFHHTMPRVATLVPLPERPGLRRYGFHGLSYESVLETLRDENPTLAEGRLIVAHLGNGASMAAIRNGGSVETTMGFTPAGGLVMGTRTGDLDPGVLLYLLRQEKLQPDELGQLINHHAGMTGISGGSGDMRDLLAREANDPRAADAVALFCYQAKKFLGGLTTALGGLDGLIFTGGIGEHAAPVRERICADLGYLGIAIDPQRNLDQDAVLSPEGAPVTIRIVHTDEDRMLARHALRMLDNEGAFHV